MSLNCKYWLITIEKLEQIMGIVCKSEFMTPPMSLSLASTSQQWWNSLLLLYLSIPFFCHFPIPLSTSSCTLFHSYSDKHNISEYSFSAGDFQYYKPINLINVTHPQVPSHLESIVVKEGLLLSSVFILFILFFFIFF